MIGLIEGTILEKNGNVALVMVSGVGYEIEMPLTDLCALPGVGQACRLYTHFVVREDAQLLYGFLERSTRDLFRQLIRINGVGPKMGLALLSAMNVAEFCTAITQGDARALTKVPGVGKKTADRLIVEVQDRVAHIQVPSADQPGVSASPVTEDALAMEAQDALVALGYKSQEAARMIDRVMAPGDTIETIIRKALKGMVKSR